MKVNIKEFDNIIFDLGGVILDLDFQASINAFCEIGLKNQIFKNKLDFSNPTFHSLQRGEVSPIQFRTFIRTMIGNPELSDKQIDEAWSKMLVGIPSLRVAKIKELHSTKKVFLFSNTNEIHILYLENWFQQKYGFSFSSLFDGIAYSHEIKDVKPSVSSFLKVIELFKIVPKRTLFIDDIEENTIGAQKAGLNTFLLLPELDITKIF
jgi:putative hydrolase of the HAD superfamily